jgi:hypothetical protein
MTLEVGYYVAQDAVEHWPEVAAMVAQVLPKMEGEFALSDFVAGFAAERFHLFIGYEDGLVVACMITSLVEYPQYKVLEVPIAAGRGFGKFIKKFQDYISTWAKVNGALYMQAYTSPAMTRYHRRFGAQKVYDVIRYPLGE